MPYDVSYKLLWGLYSCEICCVKGCFRTPTSLRSCRSRPTCGSCSFAPKITTLCSCPSWRRYAVSARDIQGGTRKSGTFGLIFIHHVHHLRVEQSNPGLVDWWPFASVASQYSFSSLRPTQPGHPSVCRGKYWRYVPRHRWGRKEEFCYLDCWHTSLCIHQWVVC